MSKFLDIMAVGAVKIGMNKIRSLFSLNSDTLSDEDRREAVQSRLYGMGYRYDAERTEQFSEEYAKSSDHVSVYTRANQGDTTRQDFALLSNPKFPDTYSRITSGSTVTFFDQPKMRGSTEFYPDVPEIKNWTQKSVADFLSKTELSLVKKHVASSFKISTCPI